MRTPGDDADLILGLLASESAIASADEVEAIVFTRHPDEPDLTNVADVRQLLAAREDVGRHDATDKAFRWRLRAGDAGARAAILAVSGRASFEIVQKAVPPRSRSWSPSRRRAIGSMTGRSE
jgi:formate dehydrogenase assembly factor FdhD